MRQKKALLAVVAVLALGLVSLAKTSKLTGKMVAYDLMRHTSKVATNLQNEELVVLETAGLKQKYVKVMYSSAGSTQLDPKYFDGTQLLEVDAFRDKSCDEKAPTFVPQVNIQQIAGTYLLTDAFRSHPPARIKNLECYVAIYKTKKKKK
ncbi:MAG TPA: hypothetical protein VGS27_19725 [Candidatus Sulfotelmatobacter sp.]|nr:hypothetical protein [Candidatus Sulfotelmatobacter sp.]